jgi:hypothetical protein
MELTLITPSKAQAWHRRFALSIIRVGELLFRARVRAR